MTIFVLWLLAFVATGCAFASALLTGASNLTVGLALVATGITILALVSEGTPSKHDRRPW